MARIVVLTPNPAIDVTYRVDSDQPGESHRVTAVTRRAGGKGVNVAAVLRTLGKDPMILLPLGGWSGEWFHHHLHGEGIPLRSVAISGETRFTVATIVGNAHPTLFLESGPTLSGEEQAALTAAVSEAVEGADAFILSGSLPPGVPPALVGTWVKAARHAGALTVVDTSGDALLAAAAAGADVVKPNRSEACAATDTRTAAAAAEALRARGARSVVISAGSDGITGYTTAGSVHVAAVPGVEGNPTGAGDAATAALTAALVEGETLTHALRNAAAAGAAAVLSPVAGDIDHAAYTRFATTLRSKDIRP